MAPEQDGQHSYSSVHFYKFHSFTFQKQVDIWAMAMLFYQLLHDNMHPIYRPGMNREEYLKILKKGSYDWKRQERIDK